jgi:hypothetical protein
MVNYRLNVRQYRYSDAWKNFKEFYYLLNLENFDLNNYSKYKNSNILSLQDIHRNSYKSGNNNSLLDFQNNNSS